MDNPNKRTRNATSPLTPGAAVDRILARRATQAARLEAVISGFDAAEREAAIRRATDSLAARFNAKRNGVLNQLSPVERDAVTAASAAIKAALS